MSTRKKLKKSKVAPELVKPEPKEVPEAAAAPIPEDLQKLVNAHRLFDTILKLLNTGMFQRLHMEHVERCVGGIVPTLADIARQIHSHEQAELVAGAIEPAKEEIN